MCHRLEMQRTNPVAHHYTFKAAIASIAEVGRRVFGYWEFLLQRGLGSRFDRLLPFVLVPNAFLRLHFVFTRHGEGDVGSGGETILMIPILPQ